MASESKPVVIDHGSYKCRAGFAGEDRPRTQFLSMTGHPKTDDSEFVTDLEFKGTYIGDRLLPVMDQLKLRCPIEHGVVTDWDGVEKIWQHVLVEQLKVDPEEHPVLLTEHARNPKINREKAAMIMFESFNVPAFYLAQQAVLSLFSTGRTDGIVLDSGYSVTHIVPVYQGHNLVMGNRILDLGGSYVTDIVRKGLKEKGVEFKTRSEFLKFQDFCEKVCYTAVDYEMEIKSVGELEPESYVLPDGTKIVLGTERFRCVELFFQPTNFGFECFSVPELINDSINKLDSSLQNDMYSNILISGGPTMYPNFEKRLQRQMTLFNAGAKVISPDERHLSAWRGGALVTSLSEFSNSCISKAEYDEYGPTLVHKKCF